MNEDIRKIAGAMLTYLATTGKFIELVNQKNASDKREAAKVASINRQVVSKMAGYQQPDGRKLIADTATAAKVAECLGTHSGAVAMCGKLLQLMEENDKKAQAKLAEYKTTTLGHSEGGLKVASATDDNSCHVHEAICEWVNL